MRNYLSDFNITTWEILMISNVNKTMAIDADIPMKVT